MRFIAVPILIILMATQAFSKWVILFEFKQNQEYITKTFCENKARPTLKCKGQCQLKKTLEKENGDSTSSTMPTSKLKFNELLFSFTSASIFGAGIVCSSPAHHAKNNCWKYLTPVSRVFRPPLA